jgi:hypothetical protein
MNQFRFGGQSWARGVGIGVAVAVLTGIIMVALTKAGVSPFPEPPSLAFAETILGRKLPLPVGLLFHAVYVTFWSAVFVRYFPRRDLKWALALAGALWLVILVVFFPIVGWGFAGLEVSPKLIAASFLPHLLFGLFLWGLDRYLPPGAVTDACRGRTPPDGSPTNHERARHPARRASQRSHRALEDATNVHLAGIVLEEDLVL